MRKMKKFAAFMLAMVLMVTSLVACGSGDEEVSKTKSEDGGKDEVVTLKWIQVGAGMPKNYDEWLKHTNAYLEEKIGVNIDVEVVTWADWENRRSVVVNGGEYFDILFTDTTKYNSEVGLGAFLDITELLPKSAPDLYKMIPEDYWKAVSIDGKIYAIPTYKDSSATEYFVWDKELAEKNNIDYKNINTYEDLEPALKKLKESTGSATYIMDKSGADWMLNQYDQMGGGLPAIGVKFDDESRTVVNTLEQEDILSRLDIIHRMYKEGIVNADAPNADQIPDYRPFFTAQGWSGAAKATWGPNMGVEAEAIQYGDTIMSNTTVRGSLNGIYSGTKYPEKCLEFLNLVNTDTKARDMFYYGLEGDNFKYTEDNKVEKINNEWQMAGYTQGTFFNVSLLSTDEFNQWDEVKELNEKAKASVLLGFNLNTKNIETELANCRSVYEKYKSELWTGAKEPRELVKQISKELEGAGFDKVLKEAQAQIDAAYKK